MKALFVRTDLRTCAIDMPDPAPNVWLMYDPDDLVFESCAVFPPAPASAGVSVRRVAFDRIRIAQPNGKPGPLLYVERTGVGS